MDFHLLGPLEVLHQSRAVSIGGPRAGTVLALLALRANRVVTVERLITDLWDRTPQTARQQVVSQVSALRRVLDDVIVTRSAGYMLQVAEDQVDLAVFDGHVRTAQRMVAANEKALALEYLNRALSLWRGPALDGLSRLTTHRRHLDERRLLVMKQRISLKMELGRNTEVVPELAVLAASHPFDEQLHGKLMMALSRCGRRVDAIEAYRKFRTSLVEEHGIDPSVDLQQLNHAILLGGESLVAVGGDDQRHLRGSQ
ncbi:AfsR/SARP family transcriptional regulator [Micromonospora sp. BQ11]|uniref:AfsR/SARP family transcriptional regulator n=1 Tax=Micromonospora sp. BQ11 TaxID=3452212 RepID=UPI003F8A263C